MSENDLNDEINAMSHSFQSVTTSDIVDLMEDSSNECISSNIIDEPNASNRTSLSNTKVRNLPEVNLPEKILFVVDTMREQNCTPFKLGTGAKYPPLFMIKRVIEIFVHAKSTLQKNHDYALMTLNATCNKLVCDFTNDIKIILNHLDKITDDVPKEEPEIFDLGLLFESITKIIPTTSSNEELFPPQFVSRVIFIYSRSNCMPRFLTDQLYFEQLMEHKYFFLDILFVHEPLDNDNSCEEVYKQLTALDTTNISYILEVGRNATKLHDNMAKLLAHPLQRPLQKDTNYAINVSQNLQEVHTSV